MASIPDLAPCTYLPLPSEALLAVGWLERDHDFTRGEVSIAFFEKLHRLCASPWQPVAAAGFHECGLCQFEPPRFSNNVFIPFEGHIYVAPVAITHYIAAHWYRPPEVFIQAVLQCPEMKSMEYKQAILANGGRSLVRQITDLDE